VRTTTPAGAMGQRNDFFVVVVVVIVKENSNRTVLFFHFLTEYSTNLINY
jgi:hypothetical protein